LFVTHECGLHSNCKRLECRSCIGFYISSDRICRACFCALLCLEKIKTASKNSNLHSCQYPRWCFIISLTALSERTPAITDAAAFIYWVLGHAIYGSSVGVMVYFMLKNRSNHNE